MASMARHPGNGDRTGSKKGGPVVLLRLVLLLVMAGDTDAYKQAHVHLIRANEALLAKRVTEAIEEYQTAYRLYPSPLLFYNLGQAYEIVQRKQAALEAYEAFVAGVPQPKEAGKDLDRWLEAHQRATLLREQLGDPPRTATPVATPLPGHAGKESALDLEKHGSTVPPGAGPGAVASGGAHPEAGLPGFPASSAGSSGKSPSNYTSHILGNSVAPVSPSPLVDPNPAVSHTVAPKSGWSRWWLVGAGIVVAGAVATIFIVNRSSHPPCAADLGCAYN
jgi:hypothetical protein